MTQRRPSIVGGNGLKSSDFTPLNRSRDSKINLEDSFFNKGGLETPCRSHICLDSRKPKNFISNLSFISLNFKHLCNRSIAAVLFENFAIPLSISQKEEVVRAQAQQRLESNSYCLYPSSYSSQTELALYSHHYARTNFSKPFNTKYLAQKLAEEKNKRKAELMKKLDLKHSQLDSGSKPQLMKSK